MAGALEVVTPDVLCSVCEGKHPPVASKTQQVPILQAHWLRSFHPGIIYVAAIGAVVCRGRGSLSLRHRLPRGRHNVPRYLHPGRPDSSKPRPGSRCRLACNLLRSPGSPGPESSTSFLLPCRRPTVSPPGALRASRDRWMVSGVPTGLCCAVQVSTSEALSVMLLHRHGDL